MDHGFILSKKIRIKLVSRLLGSNQFQWILQNLFVFLCNCLAFKSSNHPFLMACDFPNLSRIFLAWAFAAQKILYLRFDFLNAWHCLVTLRTVTWRHHGISTWSHAEDQKRHLALGGWNRDEIKSTPWLILQGIAWNQYLFRWLKKQKDHSVWLSEGQKQQAYAMLQRSLGNLGDSHVLFRNLLQKIVKWEPALNPAFFVEVEAWRSIKVPRVDGQRRRSGPGFLCWDGICNGWDPLNTTTQHQHQHQQQQQLRKVSDSPK